MDEADASAVDAMVTPDADPGCTADIAQTFFADQDGDGYGSPDLVAIDCTAPEGFVENDNDCDDTDSRNNPDAPEICDGLDNDCDAATTETCPDNCLPQLTMSPNGGTKVYLFCNQGLTHAAAATVCEGESMEMVRVDDLEEQSYLSAQRVIAFGVRPETWIGASDPIENTWVWADGTGFWQGRANGTPIDDLFNFWRAGEPNDGGNNEDCALMLDSPNGRWDDRPCGLGRRFICERSEAP